MRSRTLVVLSLAVLAVSSSAQPRLAPPLRELPRATPTPDVPVLQETPPTYEIPGPAPTLCNYLRVVSTGKALIATMVQPPFPVPPPCETDGPEGYALMLCEARRNRAIKYAELQATIGLEFRISEHKRELDRCTR